MVNSCNEIEPFFIKLVRRAFPFCLTQRLNVVLISNLHGKTHARARLGSVRSVLILSSHMCSFLINGILYVFHIEFLIWINRKPHVLSELFLTVKVIVSESWQQSSWKKCVDYSHIGWRFVSIFVWFIGWQWKAEESRPMMQRNMRSRWRAWFKSKL